MTIIKNQASLTLQSAALEVVQGNDRGGPYIHRAARSTKSMRSAS